MTKISFVIDIKASQSKVFEYLAKLENHPHFSTQMTRVESLGGGKYRVHGSPGEVREFQAQIARLVDDQSVVVKTGSSSMKETGFDLRQVDGATTRVEQWFEIDFPRESDEAKELSLKARESLANLKYNLED